MLKRVSTFVLLTTALFLCSTTITADPPPTYQHPDADWLTWTLKDTKGDTIDLSAYDDQTTFVLVFSASDKKAAKAMRLAAKYIRNNPNKASKIIGMCSDDTGHKALKLHIRQEEWTKRVKAWEEAQEEAEAAAIAAEEEFEPEEMPDFLQEILDEIDDPDDLQDLMDHHYPFEVGCRCEEMWDWLSERVTDTSKAPFALKVNKHGQVLKTWTTMPNKFKDIMDG